MSQSCQWVPGNAPLDEGYWEALLRDGERSSAAPSGAAARAAGLAQPSPASLVIPEVEEPANWWAKAASIVERGEVLESPVVGCNRRGVLVERGDLRGFVPAFHLLALSSFAGEVQRREELRSLIGPRLCLQVLEVDAGEEHCRAGRAIRVAEDDVRGASKGLVTSPR